MRSKLAITKLQAILIIDIIVVALAATGFYYVESYAQSLPPPPPIPLSPAQIQMMALDVSPASTVEGQPVLVTINVTNTGEQSGTIALDLNLDTVKVQSQDVSLAPAETKTANFTVSSSTTGTHLVKIGNLEGAFVVISKFEYSNFAINRTEAKIGEPVGISVKILNKAQQAESYSLALTINDAIVQTKTGQVGAGSTAAILFEVVEQAEGTYQFKIANFTGSFKISVAALPPKPAEFQVSDLTVDPGVVQVNNPVTVTAKVTNNGEVSGSYAAELRVNGALIDTRNLQLAGGEAKIATFTVSESASGNYEVKIGNTIASFVVQEPGRIDLSNLAVTPVELWGGQEVTVSIKTTNSGTSVSSVELKLKLDGEFVDSKTVQLAPSTFISAVFKINAPQLPGGDIAHHSIEINGIQGSFDVVKDGYHTLFVDIVPRGDADFNMIIPGGTTVVRTTPYTEILPVGSYTVTMPLTDPTGKVTFQFWSDKSTSLTKTVSLTAKQNLIATYSGGSSCPSLYIWNGTTYLYLAEISNHGWLGYTRYVNSDGSLEYWRNNPWDYIPIDKSQLQEVDGQYRINLTQRWDEIFFVDSAYMVVVDHPAGQNVYSTMVEQYIDPNYMGKIYTVSKTPLVPVSATNELVTLVNGVVTASSGKTDALAQISAQDGVFTSGYNGKYSPAWNNQTWNRLTLNLGNLTGAKQIKLVVRSLVDFGPAESYTLWMSKFYSTQVPDHTEPTPTPFMEIKDANGNWVRVPDNRQIPMPPDVLPRNFVVDLTGLFPTNDYSLRINNFWNVTYDYIGIDTSVSQNVTIQTISPQANLRHVFTAGISTGNFTKYGNVTELLLNEDDMFVIGKQGDSIDLQFASSSLTPLSAGMERDYFFFVACWFKVQYANYGFGPGHDGFTVDPLPFHNMSGFPYPLQTENYPNDSAHLNYLQQWNTRVINAPTTTQSFQFPIIALPIAVFIAIFLYVNFRVGAFKSLHLRRQKRN